MSIMGKLAQTLTTILFAVAAFALMTILFLTVYDVALRTINGRGVAGVVEYSEVALIFIVLGGFALAERTKSHIRTGIVTSRLKPTPSRVVRIIGSGVAALLVLGIAYISLRDGLQSMEFREVRMGLAEVPVWPAKMFIPIAWLALSLQFVVNLVNEVCEGGSNSTAAPSNPVIGTS